MGFYWGHSPAVVPFCPWARHLALSCSCGTFCVGYKCLLNDRFQFQWWLVDFLGHVLGRVQISHPWAQKRHFHHRYYILTLTNRQRHCSGISCPMELEAIVWMWARGATNDSCLIPVFQLVKHSVENLYLNEKAGCLKKAKMGISQPNKYTSCLMPIFTAHFVMSFSQLLSNLLFAARLKFYSLRACVSGWSCANWTATFEIVIACFDAIQLGHYKNKLH